MRRSSLGCSFALGFPTHLVLELEADWNAIEARQETTGMKAVGYKKSLPIEAADALIDFETAKPEPRRAATSASP